MRPSATVAVVVGSLRAGSYSRRVAKALIAHAPPNLHCRIIEIADLPLYNEDLESNAPAPWKRFRQELRSCQAVLFVTPEYNRSTPGCLKNALDVGSRPGNDSVWNGLPAGVVSVTPYKLGAFGANHALRQTFVFLNMPVMQQPEAYIGGAADLFNDDGSAKSPDTDKIFTNFMEKLSQWMATVSGPGSPGEFNRFMETRKEAALAYINGDANLLDALVTGNEPATFFHPKGDQVRGAGAVQARYDADARAFGRGATGHLEILQSGSSGDLAFWTGLQHAEVHMQGKKTAMTLRITEVFRFEDGNWKLVHRHADMPPSR
jgi:NAD(P)H-dependent FMN reductase/ketosteroid isomerase-like protein